MRKLPLLFLLFCLLVLPAESAYIIPDEHTARPSPSPTPSPTHTPSPAPTPPDLSQFIINSRCPLIFKTKYSELRFYDYYTKDGKPINGITRIIRGLALKEKDSILGWGIFHSNIAPEKDNRDIVILIEIEGGILKYITLKELAELIEFEIKDWHIMLIRKTRLC